MADTTFVSGTVVASDWLNDVNDGNYNIPRTIALGGTGQATAQLGINALTAVSSASKGDRLKKNSSSNAAFSANEVYNVKDFGAVGDGTTDDTTAIAAAATAANAAGGGTVWFPAGTYKVSTLTCPTAVQYTTDAVYTVAWQGADWRTSMIVTNSATGNVFDGGSRFENLGFYTSVPRTAGAYITLSVSSLINNCYFRDYFTGIAIAGSVINVENCFFYNSVAGGNAGISITNGADVAIRSCVMDAGAGVQPTYGIKVTNVADLTLHDLNIIHHGYDLALVPGAGEGVFSVYASQCYFDTSANGVLIAPSNGTGGVYRCMFNQCWFSSSTLNGLNAVGTTGTVDGLDFIDCQFNLNVAGAVFTDVDHIRLIGGNAGGNTSAGGAIWATGTVDGFAVDGMTIGDAYGLVGNTGYGIVINDATISNIQITNCDLTGNFASAVNNSTSTSQRWHGNITGDTLDITAAATITLLPQHENYATVSGNTNITSVTASWIGRQITLVFSGTPTFTDGSNLKLAGNLVCTADDSITIVCNGTNWYEVARSVN